MLKKLFLGALMLISLSAFAQEENQMGGKTDSKATSETVDQLTLANQLVKFGYQNSSALPLIQAVQIYKKLNVKEEAREKTTEGGSAPSKSVTKNQVVSFNEDQILADATKFAAGNKNLLGLIDDAKKATRSPVGGAVRHSDCVSPMAVDVYRIYCRGGEATTIYVSGDGDTDLDLYVYDSNGNLISSDTDGTDECLVRFIAYRNHTFTVRVRNRGRITNCYTLYAI